jgi:hypothetical protein
LVPILEESRKSRAKSASSPAAPNLKFEREDWTSFRTVEGLQQKAGVAKNRLRRLVLKELTDNGLDNAEAVQVGPLPGGGYFVQDNGGGIEGRSEQIARLFSIARPMISTKLLRLPSRGALGNGLRVVAGAVLASGGSLTVTTGNRKLELHPERDGSTSVISVTSVNFPIGTRIEISFGLALPEDDNALSWANTAVRMAQTGRTYQGKSSPWWYDAGQFHELLSASGHILVRELVASLDGCTGARAGEIVTQAGLSRMICSDVSRQQAAELLEGARANARAVKPKRLGAAGEDAHPGHAYAATTGTARFGSAEPMAEIPFVVEAWASESTHTQMSACVNRTPVASDIHAARSKREINLFGCGLGHTIAEAPKDKNFAIRLNIIAPYIPITSDGKEPDLELFLSEIQAAVASAVRKARRPNAHGMSQKDIVLDNLEAVITDVSGGGKFRYNVRQLFYGLRPIVMNETGIELQLANYTKIITEYESDNGEIPLMYREPRGTITHPHRNETITLGTLMVEDYERPLWTFNKLVYIEKEGASEALKAMRWGERHDCAVLSSKGFSTRAARDLIDKLAEHDEPIQVFCIHDADASGTLIYQTLQQATKARAARKIAIVNLGLEPWEAIAMGLEIETLERGSHRKPVADYVRDRDPKWDEWLQTNRVELNAMTTPQFINWLDSKMDGYGKLIPPSNVLKTELDQCIEARVRAAVTERILREAGVDDQITAVVASIKAPTTATLVNGIKELFERKADRPWRDHIEAVAEQVSPLVEPC